LIRTLKENLLWVRHFATVAELSEALREFQRRYNREWLIERHGFRTPSQVRSDSCGRSRDLDADRGDRAGAAAALDPACTQRVKTLALDAIFFGGDRPWSGSSRPA
jgi:hypothetical protein